jgi:hypothetical protein
LATLQRGIATAEHLDFAKKLEGQQNAKEH